MKIGIAGCGGIGSNVAMHLVRAGIRNFKIIDFDKIEDSNLNRQFYFKDQIGEYKSLTLNKNLLRINDQINIETITEKITEKNVTNFFQDCNIIIEAFDKKEYKKLLIENYKNKIIISANGIGGRDLKNIKVKKYGNLNVVGDFQSDIKDYKTYSTKVMFVATIMANIVLDYMGRRAE